MRSVQGKKALITGAASGIGQALALRMAREGADLFLLDIDEEGLADTREKAESFGNEILTLPCDISRPHEISMSVQRLLSRWGGLDILVNNAGVCYYGSTAKMTSEQWNWLLSINLLAPVQFVRELLPTLLSRPEGHIVNVSSIFGLVATGRCCAYHVSKYGLLGFSEALRAEFSRHDLGVTAVCPGFVATNLFARMACDRESRRKNPPWWMTTTAEKVADKIVHGIRRNKRLILVTWAAYAMYYGKKFAPGLLDLLQKSGKRRRIKERNAHETRDEHGTGEEVWREDDGAALAGFGPSVGSPFC